MRQVLSRGVLILVTLLVVILYYVPIGHVDFAENWGEGTFGIALPPRTTAVVGVDRGSPADRAGVRIGDRLADDGKLRNCFARTSAVCRRARKADLRTRSYQVHRNAKGASESRFGLLQRIGGVLAYIPPTVFLVVAFLLVFLAAVDHVVVVLRLRRRIFRHRPGVHVLVARAHAARPISSWHSY